MSELIHPPPQPASRLGPYLSFQTTNIQEKCYLASCLLLSKVGDPLPIFTLNETELEHQILYQDLFGYNAIRIQLQVSMLEGNGSQKIEYRVTWRECDTINPARVNTSHIDEGAFHVPNWEENVRAGFFSCNGFDSSVTEERAQHFGFDDVWKHLNSVNDQTPMHLVVAGGDQVYMVMD
jgi:hypothetical protein